MPKFAEEQIMQESPETSSDASNAVYVGAYKNHNATAMPIVSPDQMMVDSPEMAADNNPGDPIIQLIFQLCEDYQSQIPKIPSVEEIEKTLFNEVAEKSGVGDVPVRVNSPEEYSEADSILSSSAPRTGNDAWLPKVKHENLQQLMNGRLTDLVCGNLNTPDKHGRTALMNFVNLQNIEGVKYCSLFLGGCDFHLFGAIAEASLLPSDEIFNHLLDKAGLNPHYDGSICHPFVHWKLGGWLFLNSELNNYRDVTLEELLLRTNKADRLQSLRIKLWTNFGQRSS